jgi:uncharacterized protein
MRTLLIVLSTAVVAAFGPTAPGLAAQAPAPESPRVIQVSARATVQQAPDRAVIQLAVETVAGTAGEATQQNAAVMDRVMAALRQLGIPDARIRTTRVELHPRYDHRREAVAPTIIGYQAVNQVTVRVDDIDRVGAVVDAAVGAGANRVTGISFQLSDPDAPYREALRLAVTRARQEAQVIADALGETLGPPLQVATGGMPLPPPGIRMQELRMEMDVAAVTPVQPGELDVHAHVSITYRLGS